MAKYTYFFITAGLSRRLVLLGNYYCVAVWRQADLPQMQAENEIPSPCEAQSVYISVLWRSCLAMCWHAVKKIDAGCMVRLRIALKQSHPLG